MVTISYHFKPVYASGILGQLTEQDFDSLTEQEKMGSEHHVSLETPVVYLKCEEAFGGLTEKEKKYAHYLSKSSWLGSMIILSQCSPESPWIFSLFSKLYRSQSFESLQKLASEVGMTDDEFKALNLYYCTFLYNMGNYLGFGDKKFVPTFPQEKLEKLLRGSQAYATDPSKIDHIMSNCMSLIYDLSENKRFLGFPEKGVTTYLSPNCTTEDANLATEYMTARNLEGWNSRLIKIEENDQIVFDIRLASVEQGPSPPITMESDEYKGKIFKITRGDFSYPFMKIIEQLELAKEFAANPLEQSMLDKYITSFRTGSQDAHKLGSIDWVNNKSPAVETYMGFIEVYRDPTNQRAAYESFVAAVNREQSRKFDVLVERAPKDFLPMLPWGPEFEEDVFMKPDYSSLDVITFASEGMPIGINIPNYKEVKEEHGFKNVTLSNAISARSSLKGNPFLQPEDQDLKEKYSATGLEIAVGLHELLGHGSGKFLRRKADGTLNFDPSKVMNPYTGEKAMFYETGENFQSVFTSESSAYEECRAEAVAIYLIFLDGVFDVFDVDPSIREDVRYIVWLDMLYGGLRGLEMYQPTQAKWGQAHCQARYVLLRVALEAGVAIIEETVGADGLPDLKFSIDRSKIASEGRAAAGEFLKKLQVFRSMGDGASGKALFAKYSEVPSDGSHPFAKWHEIIVRKRKPRLILTMPNTTIVDGKTELKSYPDGIEGKIASWVERFSPEDYENIEDWLISYPDGKLSS